MGKINLNSRSNYSSIYGLIEKYADTISQKVNADSDVVFKTLSLSDSLTVNGNLTVNGSTTVISTDTIEFQDNIIEINAGELGAGVSSNLSGMQINRGLSLPYQFVFEEISDSFKVGEIHDLQTVATREGTPLPNGIMIFNNDSRLLESRNEIPIDITFNGSSSIGSLSGAIRVLGGMGVSEDIFIDGKIYFKGSGYGNHISGNGNNDLVLRADNDFNIDLSAGKNINVPANVSLAIGTSSISNDTSDLNVSSAGNVAVSADSLVLQNNTDLVFETGNIQFLDLSFNGESMAVNAAVNITNALADAFVVAGGVLFENSADSQSSSAGGALTVVGGVSIGKKLIVGGSAVIENGMSCLQDALFSKKLLLGTTSNSGTFSEPLCLHIKDFGFTDTVTPLLGVVAQVNSNYIGSTILSASNSGVTVNSSSTVFIKGPPVAGINMTLVDTFSLNVNSGTSRFNGRVLMNESTVSGEVASNSLVSSKLLLAGSINAAPGNQGKYLHIGAYSINDSNTQSQVTASDIFFNVIEAGSLTATNAITTTNSATLVINGAPIAQTNQTIVNKYALWVKSGVSKTAQLETNAVSVLNVSESSITTQGGIHAEGSCDVVGGLTVAGLSRLNGTLAQRLLVGDSSGSLSSMESVVYESQAVTKSSSVVSDFIGFSGFKAPTVSGAGTTTEAATLYIQGSPLEAGGHEIQASYSLLVQAGDTKLNGLLLVSSTTASTSANTGALVVAGGLAIAKNIFIGTTLYTGGNVGVGTSLNVNSELTMVKNSVIGLNTLGGSDDGFLCLSGSGTSSASRGGVITLFGQESSGNGSVVVSATSLVDVKTLGTSRLVVQASGVVSASSTVPSSAPGVGAVVLQGGLSIANTTNSSNATNGGTFTTAGGVAIAKDTYIGGDLHVSGSVINASAVSAPTITASLFVNVSGVSVTGQKLITVNQERTLSGLFLVTPSSASIKCEFEFTVPLVDPFTSAYGAVPSVQGFTADFTNIENIVCYTLAATNRAKISFTSHDTSEHALQFIIRY